jgi:hypothetical protein
VENLPYQRPHVPSLLALLSCRLCGLPGDVRVGACLLCRRVYVVQFLLYFVHPLRCSVKIRIESSLVPALLPVRPPLQRGEMGKEGFRGVAVRKRLNKTMPLIHPVVPTIALTLFLPMHTDEREVIYLTPAERTPQGLPEFWLKKRFSSTRNSRS